MIERDQTTWSKKFTILGSVVNFNCWKGGGDIYGHLSRNVIFTLKVNKIFM